VADKPKISVIIPVYNAEKYLRQCLDSVVNQTLKDIEIICINDRSIDDSLKILGEYAAKDSRIIILNNFYRLKAGETRNLGINEATGKYLHFLDADDFFKPSMLENMYVRAQDKQADIVMCRSMGYNHAKDDYFGMEWSINSHYLPENDPFSFKDMPDYIFNFCPGWAWDKLYRAGFVKDNNLHFQDIRTNNDVLFVYSSLVKASRISVLDMPLVYHRVNTSVSLQETREYSWECFYQASTALCEELKSIGVYDQVQRSFINWVLYISLWNLRNLRDPEREKLYEKLRSQYFKDFGISQFSLDYFYRKGDYSQYLKIVNNPYNRYNSDSHILQLFSQFIDVIKTEGIITAAKKALRYVFKR
jgi:glycosyltransferase involved in cell wall biosynthesis